ncbi:PREDICTED: glioma tumor suppressor candidate region gene 1 protein [Chaetura pelagica]|uniref:glioma tumor suppressor candidate region gene 1 protein n=1 Tax=Chaetura pelagica TaxID=8897 RepID=UPI0005239BD9|nr:PREDICTED: glioma tumor suppressor candidate region gene 1 protein [Chaetura pelagica]
MDDEDGRCLLDVICDPQALNDFLHGSEKIDSDDLLDNTGDAASAFFEGAGLHVQEPSGNHLSTEQSQPSTSVDLDFLEDDILGSPSSGGANLPNSDQPCDILQQSLQEANITEQTLEAEAELDLGSFQLPTLQPVVQAGSEGAPQIFSGGADLIGLQPPAVLTHQALVQQSVGADVVNKAISVQPFLQQVGLGNVTIQPISNLQGLPNGSPSGTLGIGPIQVVGQQVMAINQPAQQIIAKQVQPSQVATMPVGSYITQTAPEQQQVTLASTGVSPQGTGLVIQKNLPTVATTTLNGNSMFGSVSGTQGSQPLTVTSNLSSPLVQAQNVIIHRTPTPIQPKPAGVLQQKLYQITPKPFSSNNTTLTIQNEATLQQQKAQQNLTFMASKPGQNVVLSGFPQGLPANVFKQQPPQQQAISKPTQFLLPGQLAGASAVQIPQQLSALQANMGGQILATSHPGGQAHIITSQGPGGQLITNQALPAQILTNQNIAGQAPAPLQLNVPPAAPPGASQPSPGLASSPDKIILGQAATGAVINQDSMQMFLQQPLQFPAGQQKLPGASPSPSLPHPPLGESPQLPAAHLSQMQSPHTKPGVISSVSGLNLGKGPLQIQVVGKGLPQLVPSVPVQSQQLFDKQLALKKAPTLQPSKEACFLEQLHKHQGSVLHPDYKTPFRSFDDALQRLLPYHVYQGMLPSAQDYRKVDEEFEAVSTQLLKRTQAMLNKYRLLLLEESRRVSPSAEMVMIDRMFIQEEKTMLALDKQLAKEKPDEFVSSSSSSSRSGPSSAPAASVPSASPTPESLKVPPAPPPLHPTKLVIKHSGGSPSVTWAKASPGLDGDEEALPPRSKPPHKTPRFSSDSPQDDSLNEHLQSAIDSILNLQQPQAGAQNVRTPSSSYNSSSSPFSSPVHRADPYLAPPSHNGGLGARTLNR